MCYFITIGVPREIRVEEAPPEFVVAPFQNDGGGHQHADGLIAYSVTLGGCSCDFCGIIETDTSALDDRFRQKLVRKGWSNAKIQRALDDRKRKGPPNADLAAKFWGYLAKLAIEAGRVDCIVHWHSGSFTSETLPVRNEQLTMLRGNEEPRPQLQPDVRHSFRVEHFPAQAAARATSVT